MLIGGKEDQLQDNEKNTVLPFLIFNKVIEINDVAVETNEVDVTEIDFAKQALLESRLKRAKILKHNTTSSISIGRCFYY